MKLKLNARFLTLCLSFFGFIIQVKAQVAVVDGPSDGSSAPPANTSAVSQVIASGSKISLKIGTTTATADMNYQWYKLDNSGTKRLVQEGSNSAYLETSTGAGYYIYQLVIGNSNQCSSDISDPFKVYVLPALTPTIAASSGTICANGTSTSTLTTNPGDSKYTYLFQWAQNGNDISGATSSTYTTPTGVSGNNTYKVKVSYALNSSIMVAVNQVINIIPVPTKPAILIGQ